MARTLRTPKVAGEVERHHLHVNVGFTDDNHAAPGTPMIGSSVSRESRKTKDNDARLKGYSALLTVGTPELMKMPFGEALEMILLATLADDERQAEEQAKAKPES